MFDNRLNSTMIILVMHLALIAFVLPAATCSDQLSVIVYVLVYAIPTLIAAFKLRDEGEAFFVYKRIDFNDLYLICLFFIIFVATSAILTLVFPKDVPEYDFSVITLTTSGILAPILEELLWRGVVLEKLSKYSTAFAMVFSSLLFALLHEGSAGLIYAFLGGMIFSLLYLRSRSVIPGIILHMANNLVAILSVIFPLTLRIVLTASLLIVILANTIIKKSPKAENGMVYIPLNRQILTSPLVYITLILVVVLRYF